MAAARLLEDPQWIHFSQGFFRAWATRMEPFQEDDNTAPGHVMCAVIEKTRDQVLHAAVLKLARHLRSRRKCNGVSLTFEDTLASLREPYGNVSLSSDQVEQMKDPGPGIYLDCMHFDPPFYAHLSRLQPNEDWAETAVSEILGYRQLLFNDELGLYRHFCLNG